MLKKIILSAACFFCFACSKAQFGLFASAAYIQNNAVNSFYNNTAPGLGQDIGTLSFQGTSFGVFEQNSGRLKLIGAEIKTYKGASDNVCSGTLYFTVYNTGSRPASPVFTPIGLGFYSDCFAPACGSFYGAFNLAAGGGCCSERDQKWQNPGFGVAANIDLTTYIPGNYTLEMYYAYTGEDGSNGCGTTKYDNNNNNPVNYTADFITTAVPVEFGNISVTNNKSFNTVSWKTYSEAQSSMFMLERSNDGARFQIIGSTPAAGFSPTPRSYIINDRSPVPGTNYYRVKMLETNGKIQYSGIVKTQNNYASGFYISEKSSTKLALQGMQPGDDISIFSTTGLRVFYKRSVTSSVIINISQYPAGTYFISVCRGTSRQVMPVVISY